MSSGPHLVTELIDPNKWDYSLESGRYSGISQSNPTLTPCNKIRGWVIITQYTFMMMSLVLNSVNIIYIYIYEGIKIICYSV